MFFDEINNRKNNSGTPPNNSDFIQMLVRLLNEYSISDNKVSTEELTMQLQIILQDEFVGSVQIKPNNTLLLCLANGEQFNIKIEKNGLLDL